MRSSSSRGPIEPEPNAPPPEEARPQQADRGAGQWDSAPSLPNSRAALETLSGSKDSVRLSGSDLAANERALRMLCIRAEILTDRPTPPEDQPLRREYQLQRLVQSLGQGLRADAEPLDAMVLEWVGVGPVEDAVYEPLLLRFRSCRARGAGRSEGPARR